MLETIKHSTSEEVLHALCTEIIQGSLHIQAACELLLTDEDTPLTEQQKRLVVLINKTAEGHAEIRELILDYLRYIQFLPSPDTSEAGSDSN
jgi:hypothetical protein